jgi:hypothetical protein
MVLGIRRSSMSLLLGLHLTTQSHHFNTLSSTPFQTNFNPPYIKSICSSSPSPPSLPPLRSQRLPLFPRILPPTSRLSPSPNSSSARTPRPEPSTLLTSSSLETTPPTSPAQSAPQLSHPRLPPAETQTTDSSSPSRPTRPARLSCRSTTRLARPLVSGTSLPHQLFTATLAATAPVTLSASKSRRRSPTDFTSRLSYFNDRGLDHNMLSSSQLLLVNTAFTYHDRL